MNQTKINVDALPCQNSSFRVWFWLMIVCGLLSISLVVLGEETFTSSNPVNIFLPILCIPGLIFNYIFAKACRPVSEKLYKYWLGTVYLSFAMDILGAIADGQQNTAINVISGILLLVGFVLAIMIIRLLVKNYTGLLGDLGKYLSIMLGIAIVGIVFMAIIILISQGNVSPGLVIGPAVIIVGNIAFYFVKYLYVSYCLLKNGLLISPDNNIPRGTIHREYGKSKFAKIFGEKKQLFSLRAICNAVSSKIAERSRIFWIVVSVILIACLVIVIAKCSFQSGTDNVRMYRTYEEVAKDASKNKDPKLTPFFENEDIVGVAVDENDSVTYFFKGTVPDLGSVVQNGITSSWSLIEGALEYYTHEYNPRLGENYMGFTIIDGYLFKDTNFAVGVCWRYGGDGGDGGYFPTKSQGKKLKKFLWKGVEVQVLWTHLAPESVAGKMIESYIDEIPIISQRVDDITYRHGMDERFHARNIVDFNMATAWVIGDKEFEEFTVETEGHFPRMIELRPEKRVPIRQIGILNGSYSYDEIYRGINLENWENYGRVKDLTIMGCFDDSEFAEELYSGTLPDETGWQIIDLTKHAAYDYYSFIINDYYPGKTNNDIAISEVVFYN